MTHLHSYPSIYSLGHRAAQDILSGPVVVQEKVDGSQFSFGVRLDDDPGADHTARLFMRTKGTEVYQESTDKLFKGAIETVTRLFNEGRLTPGYVYRGEVLAKPKHNTLAYERIPAGNIILFDIDIGEEAYASPSFVQARATELGLETVPTVYEGTLTSLDQVTALLDRVSVLGGSKIEGLVIKAYGRYGPDKKTLMAKYVTESFKEVHQGQWRKENPTRGDQIALLIDRYRTPARWAKAVQHLRDQGRLQEAVQDIGALMQEVPNDIVKEEYEAIKEALWNAFWPQIRRGVTAGLPQWYKDQLAQAAFQPASVAEIADPRPVATADATGTP